MNEFNAISRDKIPGVEVIMQTTRLWHFIMRGPKGSVFYEGRYHGIIAIPAEYPNIPPQIDFTTANGRYMPQHHLCLFGHDGWLPSYTLRSVLVSVRQNFVGPAIIGDGVIAVVDKKQAKTLATESLLKECDVCGKHSEIQLRDDPQEKEEVKDAPAEKCKPGISQKLDEEQKESMPVPAATPESGTSSGLMSDRINNNANVPEEEKKQNVVERRQEENEAREERKVGQWWYEVRMTALMELNEEIRTLRQDRSSYKTSKVLRLTMLHVEKAILTLAYRPEIVSGYCIFSMLVICASLGIVGYMIAEYDVTDSLITASVFYFIAAPLIVLFKLLHIRRMSNPMYTIPSVCCMYLEAISQIFYFWTSVAIIIHSIHHDEAYKPGVVFCILFLVSQFVRYTALALRMLLVPLFLIPLLIEYLLRLTCCKPWKGVIARDVQYEARLENEKCVICQGGLLAEQRLIGLSCHANHVFHHDCIVAWIRQKRECPCCKTIVDKSSHPSFNVPDIVVAVQ